MIWLPAADASPAIQHHWLPDNLDASSLVVAWRLDLLPYNKNNNLQAFQLIGLARYLLGVAALSG